MEAQNQTPSVMTFMNGEAQPAGTWQCPIKFGSPEDWLLARLLAGYPDCVLVAHYPATTRENPVQID